MSQASSVDQLLTLVQAMGAKSFDPIPPEQYLCFLEEDFTISGRAQRLLAWHRAHTIRGRGQRIRRTAYVADNTGRALWLKDAAQDLGWPLSNVSIAQAELEQFGLCRRDEKGRIWLCGDVLERREKNEQREGEKKGDKRYNPFCTYNLPAPLAQYFQQVDSSLLPQYEHDREVAQEHRKRIEAEALAVAREQGEQLEKAIDNAWLAKVGLQPGPPPEKPKGRPKIEREKPTVQLSLLWVPDLSVHITSENGNGHSVQNGNLVLYKTENDSVQNSYIRKSDKSDKSVSKSPGVELQNTINDTLGVKLPLTHPLLNQFQNLSKKEGLPISSVCRWIRAKVQEKIAEGYPIKGPNHGADALYKFAEKDLLPWAKQHPDEIQFDRAASLHVERKPPNLAPAIEPDWKTEDRMSAAEDWLLTFPNHPDAERTRKKLAELRSEQTKTASGSA